MWARWMNVGAVDDCGRGEGLRWPRYEGCEGREGRDDYEACERCGGGR
jgi:hypothetical protein